MLVRLLRTDFSIRRASSSRLEPGVRLVSERSFPYGLFFSYGALQNRPYRSDPPLIKSSVSASSPGTTLVTDPDCLSLAVFPTRSARREPPRSVFRRFATKGLSAGRGSRVFDADTLAPVTFPGPFVTCAANISTWRIFCYAD